MKKRRTLKNQGINWILIFSMILQIFGYYPGLIRAEEKIDPVSETPIWVLPLEDRENITYGGEVIEGYENPFTEVTLEIKTKPQGTQNGEAVDFIFGLSLDEAYQKALNENRKVQFEEWKALEENSEKTLELFELENVQSLVEVTVNLGNQFKIEKPEGDVYIKEENPKALDGSKAPLKENIGKYKIESNPEDPQKNQRMTLTLKKEAVEGEKALIGEAVVNATLNHPEALPGDVFDVSWDEEALAFTTVLREKPEVEVPEVLPPVELEPTEPTIEEKVKEEKIEEPSMNSNSEKAPTEGMDILSIENISNGKSQLPLDGKNNPLIKGELFTDTEGKPPFSELNLTIGQKEGGYAANDKVGTTFGFALDDKYLEEVRKAWEEEYEAWLISNSGSFQEFFEQLPDDALKPIVLKFDFGKELVAPIKYNSEIRDAEKNLIATYAFAKDAKGSTVFEITFIKGIYGESDVLGAAVFDLSLNPTGAGPDAKFDVVWNGTSYKIEVKPYTPPEPPEPEKDDYSLEKIGPANVDKPYIEYEIKAKVNKKDDTLKGKILEDIIPEDLEIVSVELNGKKLGEGDYSVVNRILSYTFPADTTATEASFKIKMALTSKIYTDLVNKQSWDKKYTNTASLKSAGSTPPLAESKPVETHMKMTFFSKEGKQNPTDGTKIDWVIQIDTSFSQLTNAYLIDAISADHKYDFKNGIKITDETGKVTTISEGQIKEISSNIPYKDLTLENLGRLTENNTKNVWYTYTDSDSQVKSIFILSYISDYQNKNVKVQYETIIDQKKLEEIINNPEKNMDLTNDVKLLWEQFFYGDGPGESIAPNYVDIRKDPAVGYDLLTKSPGNYDEKTQTMHWELKTNVYHIEVTDVVITDTVPAGQRVKAETLKYKTNGQGDEIPLPKGKSQGIPYYNLTENPDGTTTIIIDCGNLGTTDFYTFGFDTVVTDPSVLSVQGNKTISNKGSATGKFNEKAIGNAVEIPKNIKNTLIEKKVEKEFDVTSHDILWKITVNPNHIPINNMVITDILPTDTIFGKIQKITRILKNEKNESKDIQSEFTLDSDKPLGGITLTKNDVTENDATYCVYLTSKVTEDWLKTNSKGDFENTTELQGKVKKSPITDASAKAKTPVKNIALEKRSEDMKDGRIKWTILINEGKTDMSGLTIIEALSDEESKALTEISTDLNNFTLYKATIKSNGSFELGDKIEDGTDAPWKNAITSLTESGFEFVIPGEVGKETLALEFYSYITKNISGGAVTNTVKLESPGGSGSGDLAEAKNTFNSGFDMKQYGQMKGVPLIRLEKQSENGALITLEGATFDLVAYKKTAGSGAYIETTHKERITPENGAVIFVNLQSDVLYKLEELESPKGYEKGTEPIYYMFNATTEEDKILEKSDGNQETIGKDKIKFQKISPTTSIGSDVIQNLPTGKIEFTKKANDGITNLEGATFELSRPDGKWKNKKLTAASGSDGKVVFENLDPGEYLIKETKSPELYSVLSGNLKVTLEAGGSYNIIKNETWGSVNIQGDRTNYTVTNKYVTGEIKIKKVDKEAPGINLEGTQFALYEGTEVSTSRWSKTDATGVATFGNVPYSLKGYTIIEKTPSAGYEMPTETKVGTITGDEIKAAIGTGKGYTIEIKDPVVNKRIRRNITLTKKSNDTTSSLLKDRVFQLIYMDNDGYKPTEAPLPSQNIQEKDGKWYVEGKTDENGALTFSNIPYGNYKLEEVMEANDPYEHATYEITKEMFIKAKDGKIEFKSQDEKNPPNTIVNKLKTGGFTICKTDIAGDRLGNVKFTLEGTNNYGEPVTPQIGTTGNDGLVTFSNLQIGEYTLVESEIGGIKDPAVDGYETPKVHKVSVSADGEGTKIEIREDATGGVKLDPNKEGQYQIKNTPVEGILQLTKNDDDGRLLQGLEFKLHPVINGVESEKPLSPSAISDKNGVITFSGVPYGNYVLRETAKDGVEALTPVNLGKEQFVVTNDGKTETFKLKTETKLINTLKKAGINLIKLDQNKTPLDQVEFTVQRRGTAENNAPGSFSIEVPKEVTDYTDYQVKTALDEFKVLTGKTDTDGKLAFDGLVYGDYKLVETKTNQMEKTLEITFNVEKEGQAKAFKIDGQEVEDLNEVKNTLNYGSINLMKVDEDQKDKKLEGIEFTIYFDKGTIGAFEEAKDTPFITLTTNANGEFTQKADGIYQGKDQDGNPKSIHLVYGNYLIKETKGIGTHTPENSAYPFVIDSKIPVVISNTIDKADTSFTNKSIRGSVTLTKADEEKPDFNLKDAVFAVTLDDASKTAVASLRYDETQEKYILSQIEAIPKGYTWKSQTDKGIDYVNGRGLLIGKYKILEVQAPQGYILPETWSEAIEIKVEGESIEKKALNTRGKGNLSLKKFDKQTGDVLPNAEFTLSGTDYTDPIKLFKEVILSDVKGEVNFKDIPTGTYTLEETKAPENYVLNPENYTVTISVNAENVREVKMTNGSGVEITPENGYYPITNDPISKDPKGEFSVLKTDQLTGEKLQGAEFTLTGKNAYGDEITPVIVTTGSEGIGSFKDISKGTYTLTETKAPGNHVLNPESYTVVISVNSENTTEVKMTNSSGAEITPENGHYPMANDPIKGSISFTKVGNDSDHRKLAGLTFTLKAKDVLSGVTDTYTATSDTQGKVEFNNIPYGSYSLTETLSNGLSEVIAQIEISKDSLIPSEDGQSFTYTVGDGLVKNNLTKSQVNLTKKDQNGTLLEGVEFKVERRGTLANNSLGSFLLEVPKAVAEYTPYMVPSDEPEGVALVKTTDVKGALSFEGLVYGDYKLVETPPTHGITPMVITFSVAANGSITNTTTDPNVSFDNDESYEVKNILESGWVQVNKVFGEQGSNTLAPGATLPRGVFEIHEAKEDGTAGRFVIRLTTDDKGNFVTNDKKMVGTNAGGGNLEWEFIPGNYVLTEIGVKNTDGNLNTDYVLNTTPSPFTITNGATTVVETKSGKFENIPVRGTLFVTKLDQLYKIDGNGNLVPKDTEQGTPLDGATFMLCLKGTKDIVATMKSNGSLGEYVLSENLPTEIPEGYRLVKTNNLGIPYLYQSEVLKGEYTLVETKPPVGYEDQQKTLEITIGEKETEVVIDNPMIEKEFKISKTFEVPKDDKITEEGSYNQGNKDQRFSFNIQRTPESLPTFKFSKTVETNEQGIADFGSLPYGTYAITETATNEFVTPVIANITVDAQGVKVQESLIPQGQMDVKNALKRGEIKGKKLDVTTPSGTDGKTYPVLGATIGLFKTDKTTKLAEAVTDDQGSYSFKNIPYGEYVIKETKAPLGYTLGTQEIKVSITEQAQVVEASDINNIRNKGAFSVLKTDELTGEKLQGAEFTLTGKNAYGDEITPVVVTTGPEGIGSFKDISQGTYTLTETRQPNGYVKAMAVYDLMVEADGNNSPKITLKLKGSEVKAKEGVYEFKNTQTKITLYKEGENSETEKTTEALAGAEFGIYAEADTQCLTPIQKAISQAPDGKLEFFKIPAGTYQIKEITAPKNFNLNPQGYWITVNSNGDAIEMTEKIVNPAKRGSVTIVKVNESNPSERVPGSTYGLYKLVSNTGGILGKGSEKEVLIKEGVTDENGSLTFDQLLMDTTYMIRELSTPKGYQVSKHPIAIQFKAQEDGRIVMELVESGDSTVTLDKDGNLIWNEPPTKVKVLKTDKEGKGLAGARFRILDKNKVPVKEVEEWISTQEEHLISGKLMAGETYYLEEITAPEGYYLGKPIEFKVTKGEVEPKVDFSDKLVFVNEKKPEPPKPIDPSKPEGNQGSQGNSNNTGSKGVLTGLTGDTEISVILTVLFLGFLILAALVVRSKMKKD